MAIETESRERVAITQEIIEFLKEANDDTLRQILYMLKESKQENGRREGTGQERQSTKKEIEFLGKEEIRSELIEIFNELAQEIFDKGEIRIDACFCPEAVGNVKGYDRKRKPDSYGKAITGGVSGYFSAGGYLQEASLAPERREGYHYFYVAWDDNIAKKKGYENKRGILFEQDIVDPDSWRGATLRVSVILPKDIALKIAAFGITSVNLIKELYLSVLQKLGIDLNRDLKEANSIYTSEVKTKGLDRECRNTSFADRPKQLYEEFVRKSSTGE